MARFSGGGGGSVLEETDKKFKFKNMIPESVMCCKGPSWATTKHELAYVTVSFEEGSAQRC